MLKLLKRLILSVVVLAIVIAVLGLSYRAYRQQRLAAELVIGRAIGIDEQRFLQVNGIEHWITIRSTDRRNPIVFFVHGGPGEVVSFVPRATQPFENDFTVVHWDQRGAGRTFSRNLKPPADLSLTQMRDDGIAIVRWVAQYLEQPKVILLGHSWGTILGLNMVSAQPDLFSAYVGTGQFVAWADQVEAQYDHVVRSAEAEGNSEVLTEIAQLGGPPVTDIGEYQQFRTVMSQYLAPTDLEFFSGQLSDVWVAPRATLGAIWNALQGARVSVEALAPTLLTADIRELGSEMPVPFVIVQGAEDWITPTSLAVEYFDQIAAPGKVLIRIPESGHYAFTTHSELFVEALVSEMLPLVERP